MSSTDFNINKLTDLLFELISYHHMNLENHMPSSHNQMEFHLSNYSPEIHIIRINLLINQ